MRYILLGLIVVLRSVLSVAQVGPPNNSVALAGTTAYSFAQSSATYNAITGGTQFQAGATINTDAVSSAVNIGFNFMYNNRSYTSVRISNNGFITFGSNPPLSTTYTALSTNVNPAYEGAIAGFAANLRASAVVGAAPEIRYQTLGTAPNRIFVVQYQDMAIITTGTLQRLNFQIRLNETTNVVSIVYGLVASGASTNTGQVGLKGAESSDLNNRTGTNWTTTTAGTATTSSCTLGASNGTTVPASGMTFTWTPGISWPAPDYQVLPYQNDFASWTNGVNTMDTPGLNVRTWPSRGDNAWRPSTNLTTGFTSSAGWTSVSGNSAVFVDPAISPAARFHDYDVSQGSYGDIDFYLNMSSSPNNLYSISLLYNNPSGADVLQIWYSGDGGVTFTQLGTNLTSDGNTWVTVSRQTSGTPTSIIRLRAVGTFGNDDIYIDNFQVTDSDCNEVPALNDVAASVCSGAVLSVSPEDGVDGFVPSGTTYSWSSPTVTGSISGGAAGSGPSIQATLVNNTTLNQTATYTVLPSLGACPGESFSLTVTVSPNAVPLFNPLGPICSGDTPLQLPGISLNGFQGDWAPDFNNLNTTTYTFTPAPVNGSCASTAEMTVVVNDNDGCTDATACNYSPAGCGTSACSYPGCLDVNACNYEPTAGCSDNSCVYAGCESLNSANAVPSALSYQAVYRNFEGIPQANTQIVVRFTLLSGTLSGPEEYMETHAVTTSELGLFNLFFGTGASTLGSFNQIDWTTGPKFLGIAIDSGAGYVDIGSQQLLATPYAMHSKTAASINNKGIPIYSTNNDALAGGLQPGEMYRMPDGTLKVVF
jgi:hypothetical protein